MNKRKRQKYKLMHGPFIEPKAMYNLDIVFTKYILQGLKKFKLSKDQMPFFGIPNDYMDKYNNDLEKAQEAWMEDIDKMINAFEMYFYIANDPYKFDDNECKQMKKDMHLFIDHFGSFWI